MSAFGDRRLLARAGVALALANVRFWPTVAPLVGAQLKRWEQRAHAIEDPPLHALALEKLREEHFNAEVAATLATLAPREHRKTVVEAIVAYEVMYDYLDGLTEQPTADPLTDGRNLYQAFTDAITLGSEPAGGYYTSRPADDGGYLEELVSVVREALARLPSAAAISRRRARSRNAVRRGTDPCARRTSARDPHSSNSGRRARRRTPRLDGRSSSPAQRPPCSPSTR